MTAEVIKQLVPFGIIGLAIIAVLLIAINPGGKTNRLLALIAMAVIGVMAIFDKLSPRGKLEDATTKPPEIASTGGSVGGMYWIDTGTNADWGGRDVAYTSGLIPKYTVKGMRLCDENHAGSISICWDNRPIGYPVGIDATDVTGPTPQWCTYKDASVKLSTPPDGKAANGRIYLCARSMPHI